MIVANHLSYKVGEKVIIDDVSLEVSPKEVTVIIGSNGAGKSTLLNLLTGEFKTNSGNISLDRQLLDSIPIKELAKRRAVLPQNSTLNFGFSVTDVVMLGRSPHKGKGYTVDLHLVYQALSIVDAMHLKDRSYTSLSGGEGQRVQLARVIVQICEKQGKQARYLLLDEPTSALDLNHQHNTLKVAKQLTRDENIGVIAVLHDLNLASLYADKIIMMKDGKIVKSGSPTEVLNEKLIHSTFNIDVTVIPHPAHQHCPLIIAQTH